MLLKELDIYSSAIRRWETRRVKKIQSIQNCAMNSLTVTVFP